MPEPRRVTSPPDRPVVVFDGDCGFCRFWVGRWRHRTGDSVDYQPFQNSDISERFPEIPRERFARSVQLIEVNGRVSEAAEAVCRAFALGGRRAPLWTYQHIAFASTVAEWAYRFIADHRSLSAAVTNLLWGRASTPSTYARATWLFLRLLGLAYLFAFWSLGSQIRGLSGQNGILPIESYLTSAREAIGVERFWLLPTLAWANASDFSLQALCTGGAVLAVMLIVGILPALVLPVVWLFYLSLSIVCRDFLSYQWDALLLETGLLAILVAPLTIRERLDRLADPPRAAVRLLLWLLFRLMVGSGAVKLSSGDPTWHNLTALAVHFETQPIPTPVAWYAHHLPLWLLKPATFGVLAIEIGAPFLMVAPRRVRGLAFGLLVGLQAGIALTGNYAFFNLLTVALCVFLLDDAALSGWGSLQPAVVVSRVRRGVLIAAAVITIPISAVAFSRSLGIDPPGAALVEPLSGLVAPVRSVNAYGLFAVMTTTRPEIVIEGSDDRTTWMEYEFKYKAGDLRRRPPWVAPFQPRLDWQMWFAALGRFDNERWFQGFCVRLLDAEPDVLRLLARDPFQGRRPKYLRAVLYRYRFSDRAARSQQGVWWTREKIGDYSPILSLRN